MVNKERLTDLILASMIAIVISEGLDEIGFTDAVRSSFREAKSQVISSSDDS